MENATCGWIDCSIRGWDKDVVYGLVEQIEEPIQESVSTAPGELLGTNTCKYN
jgi:hypothetical protein